MRLIWKTLLIHSSSHFVAAFVLLFFCEPYSCGTYRTIYKSKLFNWFEKVINILITSKYKTTCVCIGMYKSVGEEQLPPGGVEDIRKIPILLC